MRAMPGVMAAQANRLRSADPHVSRFPPMVVHMPPLQNMTSAYLPPLPPR